jgi:hypothetical protein
MSYAEESTRPTPLPYLSWQDVKALYSPKRYPGDWDCPKLKSYPHEKELIAQCQEDLKLSVESNSDPFHRNHALGPGKLVLNCITKDPENRIVYFVFSYVSELESDLFVVYYFDPAQGRFILKSSR